MVLLLSVTMWTIVVIIFSIDPEKTHLTLALPVVISAC
uniref:Uncharacterized protein n=1 Tax=Arundo donax TaxID=35708 RepID=A0A0A9EHU8_ARUDO